MFEFYASPPSNPAKRLPDWMMVLWVFPAPMGLAFSARILWEKTWLTYAEGRQMIGFSLVHIHPFFFIVGSLCSMVLAIWLPVAAVYLVVSKFRLVASSWWMIAVALFVALAMFLPDATGLAFR